MFLKSLSSISIVTLAFVSAMGQAPQAKKENDPLRSFSFMFVDNGGYLGIETEAVTKDNYAKFGLREVRGVAVEKVVENSPAAAAGLQAGDVILKFNGEEVNGVRKLTRLINEVDPDHQVKITISRSGREQQLTATIGKRPEPKLADSYYNFRKLLPELKDLPRGEFFEKFYRVPDGEGHTFTWRTGESRAIGVGVTKLTKQLAQHFGVEGGVLINDVRENSPAAKAGLKAGDIIVEVDGKAVKGELDIIKAVNAKKEGDVQFTIVRDGKRQTVTVTPEKAKDSGFILLKAEAWDEGE